MKKVIWKVVQVCFLLYTVVFIMERYFLLYQIWEDDIVNIQRHQAMCRGTCSKTNVIGELGPEYTKVCGMACHEARKMINGWTSFHKLLQRTYLCGNQPCRDIVFSFTESWRTLLGVIIYLLMSPYMLWNWSLTAMEARRNYKEQKKMQKVQTESNNATLIPIGFMNE